MCVTSYGTEILQSQLNRSEKRRRCTHRNESPCLLRVVGEGRGSFPVVLCCLRPSSVFCSLCAWLHLQRGGAQPMRRSLFVYILPPPRKGNKRSRGSHFMEMCCFFSPFPSHCLSHQVHSVAKVPGTETDTRMRSCANLK